MDEARVGRSPKTDANLQLSIAAEADANRRYEAFGIRALQEGYPEIAQIFFEAAGAEGVHATSHLEVLGAVKSTAENLKNATAGELEEIEKVYPRMIAEARAEGREDAVRTFSIAMERERHHLAMFEEALEKLEEGGTLPSLKPTPIETTSTPPTPHREIPERRAKTDTVGVDSPFEHLLEHLESERARVDKRASIREVIFGGQDGLVTSATVVAGITASQVPGRVVLLAGLIAALGGTISMAAGAFTSSRARGQVEQAEIAHEQSEIDAKPGEEAAELIAIFMGKGMSREDAYETARKIIPHRGLMTEILATFELGLVKEGPGSPPRDALVMGSTFFFLSLLPLIPFVFTSGSGALALSMTIAIAALGGLGVLRARLANVSVLRNAMEMVLIGAGSGLIGYGLGAISASVLGVQI